MLNASSMKHGLCRVSRSDTRAKMIIDAHVHLYPTEIDRDPAAWAAAQGEAHWAFAEYAAAQGRPTGANSPHHR